MLGKKDDRSSTYKYKVSSVEKLVRFDGSEVLESHGADHLTIIMLDGNDFDLSFSTHKYAMIVDYIDGVSPIDNDDLFSKLSALQQV